MSVDARISARSSQLGHFLTLDEQAFPCQRREEGVIVNGCRDGSQRGSQ